MVAEYIAKITGDTSGLEKALKSVQGSMKKLSDDEVLVKLQYDGNVKEFNKVFEGVMKQCPDLTIQFQYDVNQKILEQKMKELKTVESFKLDIDSGNVQKKISEMVLGIKEAYEVGDESNEEMFTRFKKLYAYINTAKSLGIKIDPESIQDAEDISIRFEKIEEWITSKQAQKIQLFHIDTSLEKTLENLHGEVNDIGNALSSLEKQGASSRGSSEIEKFQDEIKILRSDIDDLQRDIQDLSGEKFNEMAEQVSNLRDRLSEVLFLLGNATKTNTLLKDIEDFLTGGKGSKSQKTKYWEDIVGNFDKLDEKTKNILKTLGLIDSSGALTAITDGANNWGGLIGDQNTAIVRQGSSIDNTLKLKQALDEAYESGVNCSHIIGTIISKDGEIIELQKTMKGEMLATTGNESTGFLDQFNLKALKASGEQIQKLYRDVKKLWDLGLEADIYNPSNLIYDETKGFQIIDVDFDKKYGSFKELWNDFIENIKGNVEDFQESGQNELAETMSIFAKKLEEAGVQYGKGLTEGFREGIDAHSNSKEAERAVDDFANGVVDEFEKRTEDMAQAAKKAGDAVTEAFGNGLKDSTPLSSDSITPSQQFDNEVQQNLVMLENYKNTVAEIDRLKLEPETDETKAKLEELNKLADYFASKITVIRSENGGEVNPSMMLGWGASGGWSETLKRDYSAEQRKDFLNVAKDRTGLQISKVASEFHGISDEISNIEAKSEGLRNALTKDLTESSAYVSKLRAAYLGIAEANDELKTAKPGSEDFEDYTEQLNTFLSKYPELEKFKDALGYYDKAPEFVKSDDWLDFLATLPQAHTYLESIGYDFDKINRVSNENNLSLGTESISSSISQVDNLGEELKETGQQGETAFENINAETDALQQEEEQAEQTAEAEKKLAEARKGSISSQSSNTEESMLPAVIKTTEEVYNQVQAWAKRKQQVEEFIATQKEANNVEESTTVPNESKKFEEITDNAKKAAKAKEGFSEANAEVLRSIVSSLEGLDKEAQAFDTLNKLIKNLANNKDDRILNMVANLELLRDALSKPIEDGAFINAIKDIASQGDNLKDLAAILKTSVKDIQKAKKQVNTQEQPVDNTKFYERASETLYNVRLFEKKNQYVQEFSDELVSLRTRLEALSNLDIIDDKNIVELDQLIKRFKELKQEATLKENKSANAKSVQKFLGQINEILSQNTTRKFKRSNEYQELLNFKNILNGFDTSKPQSELDELGTHILQTISRVKGLDNAVKGKGFLDRFSDRLADMNTKFLAQYFSFQDLIRYARQAVTNVIQLNDAFVELSKVSDTSLKKLESDFQSYADIAKDIGATITDTINATADWARLGYSVPDAKKLSEVALLYKNVGDGIDISQANESLISTLRGFKLEASDAIGIIDKFNEVSNNYAISSGGIGEALQRSAAAFSAANTDLSKSIALVTATNEIVQDPDAVGSMWTTVSARIRGAKSELEDMGEDTEDMVESTSKLRDLVKGITGVDIMLDENTFKDIYTIIVEIGEKWNDINDIDQAALLEALAGKRQANRLAAVLGNLDNLKAAYQTAEESAGSAQREQENYQKGITYSINQAKAALEELSYDAVNSDFLKGLVDSGTKLIEVLDFIVDKVGLLKTALIGIGTIWGSQKLGLFDFKQSGGIGLNGLGGFIRELVSPTDEQKDTDAKAISGLIKYLQKGDRTIDDVFNTDKLDDTLGNISDDVADKILEIGTASKDSATQVDALKNVLGKTSKIESFKNSIKSVGASLLSTFANAAISAGISMLISTIVGGLFNAIDGWIHRVENAEKAINESIDAYKNADSELKNLNQELKDTNDKINELQSKDSLTIVEQDELQTLKETNDELERKIRLKEREKELAAREAIQTIRTESPVALSKVNNYQDRGYEISKTYQREDGSTFIDKQMVNGALEFNAALEEEERELERIKVLLNGKEFSKDIITNAATGGYETIYHIADATEEQLNLINEEFGSLKNFYDYYQGVEDSVESMRETSKDMVYDLEGELLKVEGWLDTLDDIGYDKLGFDDQKTYESLLQTKEWLQEQVYTQSELFTIKLKVAVDDDELQGNIKKIHTHLLNSGLLDNISDTEKKEIEKWLLGLSEDEAQALADHISQIVPELINGLFGRLDPELLQKVISTYRNKIGYGTLFNNGSSDYGNGAFTTVTLFDDLIAKAKEAKSAIKDVEDATIELQDVVDETKAVDSMAKMENALASLNDLYDQVIKKPDDAGDDTLFGFADPSTINSIESAFEGLIETVDDADAKEKLSYALQDFEKTLVEFPGDADKAQYAMDKLLTAYMDQVYGLDNVTDANKEWTIALLKNKGVLNAEEVVESRLDKVNKRLLASEKKLSAVFRDNAEALDDINKGTDEYDKALQDLADEINSMFSFSDGDATFEMNVDTSFVAQNLDLIRQVAAGDAEAIIQLQDLLRAQITGNIDINTNVPQVADMVRNDLYELSQIHLDDIEVGVDISQANANIANLIDSFQKWLDAGLMSVDQINNAFASIGAEPDITETKPVKMTVSSALKTWGLSGSGAAAAQQSMGSATEIVVNMPILKYKKINNGAFSKGLKNINYQKPTTNSNDTGGSGGGGSSDNDQLQEDTKETYDWIEVKLQRLQEAYSRLDKVSGAVYESWHDRNEAVNDSLDITQQQLEAARHAAERYKKERDKFAIDAPKKEDYEDNDKQYEYDLKQYQEFLAGKDEFAEKIKKGLIGEGDIEYISNKYYKEFYDGFKEWDDKYISAFDSVRDLLDQRYDDTKKIFDNIKTQYDGVIGLFESSADSIDKLIERTEEHGFFVSKKYYQQTAKTTKDRIEAETHELHELTKARDQAVASGAIKEYSEEWYNMTKEIMDTENEINGLYTELVKLDNQQRQLDWDGFDYAIEKLDKITEETEFLVDLLDNKDLFNFEYDERGHKTYNGTMSDRGWSAAGLHASQYNKELLKSKYATEELAKVEKELATEKGKNDKNLIARREEMLNLQRESIQAAEAEKEAIKDLVSEGIEKHLDMLSQLIEKYKENLTEARDLYDYQKNIASQAKNISSLTKQLSAYSGDDSEEARATIQKLSESLDEAQTNLKETEWDRYISETNDMLDDMFENYSDVLNQRLDDVDALMVYMTDQINARGDDIQTTIEDAADDYAYTTTTEFQSLFEGNGNLISDFNGNFNDFASTTIDALKKLVDNTLEMTKGNDVMDQVASEGLTAKSGKSKNGWWYRNADGSFAANEYRDGYWYNSEGYWDNGSKAEWKSNSKGTWYQNADGWYPKNQWLKIDGDWYYFDEKGYMVTGDRQIGSKKHQFASSGKWLREYATGSKRITEDQLAWTQEQGSELIFRSSDGAMLTPLNKGDMVFTADMTKNLWDIAKNPAYANTTVKIPDSAVAARTINNDNALTVVLPNVQSYEDFKQALMKDKQITNFVQSATFGQALGKGQLNRGNY